MWRIATIVSLLLGPTCIAAQGVSFLNTGIDVDLIPAQRINTKFLEYAPTYYGGGIVFVHARDQDKLIDIKLGMPFFELMYADLGPDALPGRSMNFSPNIRTRFHEGPACFSPDERTIYFTRTNTRNGQEVEGQYGRGTMKIYSATKGPEDWEHIEALWFCSDDYSTFAPSVSSDGTKMVFTSNMPGGYGGMDLYITTLEFGEWSEPSNLGAAINTEGDEAFPFLHSKGVLFFASEEHDSKGGLDLFACLLDGRVAGEPVNLGAPFNTRQDDLTLIIDEEGMTGFFASARKSGKGKDDIYAFECSESLFNAAGIPDPRISSELAILDVATDQPVADASIWVFPVGPDGPEGISESFDSEMTRDAEGNIVIKLKPKSEVSEQKPHATSDGQGAARVEVMQNKDVLLIVRAEGYLDLEQMLDASELIHPGSAQVIGLRAIGSTGDEVANTGDCAQLNGTVVTHASDEALSGVTVSIENLCTRVRRVIQSGDLGEFSLCLPLNCDYRIRAEKDGYIPQTLEIEVPLPDNRLMLSMTREELETRAKDLEVGDVLVLEHIYYDFAKSAIRTGDARELESLARMMIKYPGIEIELQSHTDSRGTDDYNLELSEQRGMSAKAFLEARGVEAKRIRLKPMGETRLRNHCDDGVPCAERLHQENRRTEIQITKLDPNLQVRQPGG